MLEVRNVLGKWRDAEVLRETLNEARLRTSTRVMNFTATAEISVAAAPLRMADIEFERRSDSARR